MMNIAAAKDQIKDTIEAYMQRDEAGLFVIEPLHQRPIFLVGAPGIGKTAIIEQIAQELQIGVVSYSMTHHTRQSALGLPRIVHRDFEGFEYESSEYTMSEIVGSIYDYMERTGEKRGILFLDEINCVSETLYPSMLQFLQFKTFGRHQVPDDWIIVCAGNPPEYNKSVHEFDIVTLDRLREIDVEPDYNSWKVYAAEKGIHPAVTTFLEAKPDCFYLVEAKSGGGKSFVTARGWEDLAEVIALYEKLGKECNRELFAQFLRDDDICDRFTIYYGLFEKYRSDYQISGILDGRADEQIVRRAANAQFDERIALLGLLLDAVATSCSGALDLESVVVELRDELRALKPRMLEGESVDETLGAVLRMREAELARRVSAGTLRSEDRRKEALVIQRLREIIAACTLAGQDGGAAAFEVVNNAYREQVDKIQPAVNEAQRHLDNAFTFMERAFGSGREMIVFVAELSTRSVTTQFIAHFGSDSYYRHNDELQVDETRANLGDRVRELAELTRAVDDEMRNNEESSVDTGGASGLNRVSAPKDAWRGAQGRSAQTETGASAGNMEEATSHIDHDAMQAYYDGKSFEWGFASMSKMTLPDLRGKRVVDVCCRRGKGVYKLSAKVGAEGHVIGVDYTPSYISDAKAGADHAWHKNHLRESNMEFHVAYPEDLLIAGIGDSSIDAVYINNVMTLVYDTDATLAEFNRVLKPGGLLICETIFADAPRNPSVVEQARLIGNSIQAAGTKQDFYDALQRAGFGTPEVVDEYAVEPTRGFKADHVVDVVDSAEEVSYSAVALNCIKK